MIKTTKKKLNRGAGVSKQAWTEEEDRTLLKEIIKNGPRTWNKLAERMKDRQGK